MIDTKAHIRVRNAAKFDLSPWRDNLAEITRVAFLKCCNDADVLTETFQGVMAQTLYVECFAYSVQGETRHIVIVAHLNDYCYSLNDFADALRGEERYFRFDKHSDASAMIAALTVAALADETL